MSDLDDMLGGLARKYDQYRRCTCGHIKGHHAEGPPPQGCRVCEECQGFAPRGEGSGGTEEGDHG